MAEIKKIFSNYNGQTPSTGKEVEEAFNENFENLETEIAQLVSATDEKITQLVSATDEKITQLVSATDEKITQLVSETYKKDTFPYDNTHPFRSDLITKNVDKWLVNAYLDIEYEEGYRYAFSVINKTLKRASLYKHVDGQPASGNITSLGQFRFKKIPNSRFYVGSLDSQPNSWVIADFDIVTVDTNDIYYYDGIGLSPRIFKNEGTGSVIGSITTLQNALISLEAGANAGAAITDSYLSDGVSLASKSESSYAYETGGFCGWASYVGVIHNFNGIKINIKNCDEHTMTQARMRVKSGGYSGEILADVTTNVLIEPGENNDVTFTFPEIENNGDENIWVEYATNSLSSLLQIPPARYPYYDSTLLDIVKYSTHTNLDMVFANVTSSFKQAAWIEVGTSLFQLKTDQLNNIESRLPIIQEVKTETELISDNLEQLSEKINKLDNEQKWESENFSDKDATSTFSGWGCHIGIRKNFNAAELCIINRGENPITKIRVAIYEENYDGIKLVDTTFDVNVAAGATQYTMVKFNDIIENSGGKVLFLMYWCNQFITRRGYNGTYPYKESDGYGRDRYSINGNMTNASAGSSPSGYPFYFRVGMLNNTYRLTDAQVQDISGRIGLIPSEPIEISLPDRLYAIVGDTLQLFFRGMIKDVFPYQYDILITCSKGKQYPRYFEYTPAATDVGTTTFKIQIKDRNGNILGENSCQLITKSVVKSPVEPINILNVGDSLTTAGTWCKEASRRLTGSGGSPVGLGLTNIAFKGRVQGNGIGWEGNGGWTWGSYTTAGVAAFRFDVSGVINVPSINSVYTNNGQTFTVAEVNITSGSGYIRCLSTGAPLASGVLTKTSGGGDTTINFSASTADAGNPFWNNGALDFPNYVNTYMDGQVDCIFFLLTWNGQTPNRTDFSSIINTAKILVDHIHTNYPNCMIKIMGIQLPSLNGGMGANYGATGTSYADSFGMVKTALNMNKAYQDWCNEPAYSAFMEFINVSAQFDSENNMPETDVPVNIRCTKMEKRGTNGVHPNNDGYYQIGDVAFRCIVSNYCQ